MKISGFGSQKLIKYRIVFIFTLLLFFSGYVVQQRSVAQLQTAIRPRAPSPRHQPPPTTEHIQSNPTSRLSRPFGKLRDRAKLQAHFVDKDNPFDWSKLAYAQVVRDHSELCNALILFNSLHRLRSPAPKLLLFPKEWILDNDGDIASQEVETSRRLLKKAARWYQTTLVPIEPDLKDADGSCLFLYNFGHFLTERFSNESIELLDSFPLFHDPIRSNPHLPTARSHPQRRPSRLHPRLLLHFPNNRIPTFQYKLLPLLPTPRNALHPIPQSPHRIKEKTAPARFPRTPKIHISRAAASPQRRI